MQSRAAESFELAFFVANEMDSLLFIAPRLFSTIYLVSSCIGRKHSSIS